jgi:hypothetical protein
MVLFAASLHTAKASGSRLSISWLSAYLFLNSKVFAESSEFDSFEIAISKLFTTLTISSYFLSCLPAPNFKALPSILTI